MELKLRRGIRVWGLKSHGKSYSLMCGVRGELRSIRMLQGCIQDPGAGSQAPGHGNIIYSSVVFAIQTSSPSSSLGMHSANGWMQVQSGSGDAAIHKEELKD